MTCLNFEAVAKVEEHVAYAASNEYNALFKIDLDTGNCTYIMLFPEEKLNGVRLFVKANRINKKIYFIPASAKKVAVYDMETGNMDNIMIDLPERDKYPHYNPSRKFNGSVVFDKYLFMVPCTYPGIIRIDTDNMEVTCFDSWIGEEEYLFRKSPMVDGNCFLVPSVVNNMVLEFDMRACNGRLFHVGAHNFGCWSMCKNGNEYWLAPQNPGPIIKWNPVSDEIVEYDNYPLDFEGKNFYFTQIYGRGSSLYIIPAYANMGIKINTDTGQMEKSRLPDFEKNAIVSFMFELEEFLYLRISDKGNKEYYRISKTNDFYEKYEFIFRNGKEKYSKDRIEVMKQFHIPTEETSEWGLNEFLMTLADKG